MADVAAFSGVRMEPGTLYGALSRLERRGWVRPLASPRNAAARTRSPRPGRRSWPSRSPRCSRSCGRPAAHRHGLGGVMRPGQAGRLSRALVGCHPRRWRERYREEMLDVLDQHQPTARTVANLAASASARTWTRLAHRRLSLPRLRRAALISAAIAAPLALILGPIGYGIWQDDHWHPAADEGLVSAAFSAHAAILVTAFGAIHRRHGHGVGRHGSEPAAAPVAVRGRPAHGAVARRPHRGHRRPSAASRPCGTWPTPGTRP